MVFVGYVFHSINKFKYKDNDCFVPIAMAMKLIHFMQLVAISRTLKDETIRSWSWSYYVKVCWMLQNKIHQF